jgi:cytochrome c peroxidase
MAHRLSINTLPILPIAIGAAFACGSPPAPTAPSATPNAEAKAGDSADLLARARTEFGTLPAAGESKTELVALGRLLFFTTGASADGKVGCVSCHSPEHWGGDGATLSHGVFGRETPRNAPTIFNTATQVGQHWVGDQTLESQAAHALTGKPAFGNTSEAEATERLEKLPGAKAEFGAAFPGDANPVSIDHWGAAIAAYERTLVTPAPFDAWLGGNEASLSPQARHGLSVFIDVGCAECHSGPLLGGKSFEKFGRQSDYWTATHSANKDDGRFGITKAEADRYVFKVPPLRNVSRTAPYFHDGSVASLGDAVGIMADVQLGKHLEAADQADIVAFLETLSGDVPANFSAPAQ